MQVTPLQDRILVERAEQELTTAGGIIIPDSGSEKPMSGKVISVGSGHKTSEGATIPLTLKEGDSVLFGKYVGTEVNVDGKNFLIMKEDEVLGTIQ